MPDLIFRGEVKKFTRVRMSIGNTCEKEEMEGYEYKGVKIILTPDGIVIE